MNQKDYKAISEIMKLRLDIEMKIKSSMKFIAIATIKGICIDLADYIEKEEQNNIKTNHPLWLDKEVLKGAKEIREQFIKDCGVKQ